MPVLIDVSCLCDSHTDEVLDGLHKAISDPPDDGVWESHPSALLRRVVDLFTQRGLSRTAGLQSELEEWVRGGKYRAQPGALSVRPAEGMAPWSEAELAVTKLYLENLAPAEFMIDDWMLVVDYLVHRYLSPNETRTEAEWLVSRSAIMGRVQASME